MGIKWEKYVHSDKLYRLSLEIDLGGKKFTGTIFHSDGSKYSPPRESEAYFSFQSLGISNKKINPNQTDEEMEKEALAFLKKKALTRIDELTTMVNIIEE